MLREEWDGCSGADLGPEGGKADLESRLDFVSVDFILGDWRAPERF